MTKTYWGYNPPFFGGTQAVLSRQEDLRLIKNDVLQLIMTLPGERKHRPDFGTRLRAMIFEPLDGALALSLQSEVSGQISQYEPRLMNVEVGVTSTPGTRQITVTVTGTLTYDPGVQFRLETILGDING